MIQSRSRPSRSRPAGAVGALLVAVVCTALLAALLAACGGSSGGATSLASASPAATPSQTVAGPSASAAGPSPTPLPSPLVTTGPPPAAAVQVVRGFWRHAAQKSAGEAQRFIAPGSPLEHWTGDGILAAHLVRVYPHSVGRDPVPGATVTFAVSVWIKPATATTAWGAAGEHDLFENVVRMSDGSWRMWDSGTGP